MKRVLFLFVALIGIVSWASAAPPAAPAAPPISRVPSTSLPMMQIPDMTMALKHLSDALGLTPQQQSEIRPIMDETMVQVMVVMNSPSIDAKSKADEIMTLRQTGIDRITDLLTPDQKIKYADLQDAPTK